MPAPFLARFFLVALVALALFPASAQAIILFGKDNTGNLTDPGTGVEFDAVARVSNDGGGSPAGTAIHLGFGYMLTANHVANRSHVSFDGVTYYARDTSFTPVQVQTSDPTAVVDMKIFRLENVPPVSAVTLLSSAAETTGSATMVGWGRGRDPSVDIDTNVVAWGDNATINKRWALNAPRDAVNLSYTLSSVNYNYNAIRIVAGSASGTPAGLGENEGAMTTFDSGSALFQNIAGTWFLIGLATAVETQGSSTFGNDTTTGAGRGDFNYYARISTYYDDIISIVPEPGQVAAALGLLALAATLLARRRLSRV